MMDSGLSDALLEQIKGVFATYPKIEKVVLFGSRARGDFKPESDIDMAVFGENLTPRDIAMISIMLESLPMIYKIDLVHYDLIQDKDFKDIIHRDEKVIYTS